MRNMCQPYLDIGRGDGEMVGRVCLCVYVSVCEMQPAQSSNAQFQTDKRMADETVNKTAPRKRCMRDE